MVDFDTLEAGRETNDLMATRVMGWEVLHVGYIGMEDESERQRELSDWLDTLNVSSVGDYYIDVSKNFIVRVEDWQPSTDIKAAWEVVERLVANGHVVIVKGDGLRSGDFKPAFTVLIDNFPRTDAETAALAICLSAVLH